MMTGTEVLISILLLTHMSFKSGQPLLYRVDGKKGGHVGQIPKQGRDQILFARGTSPV